jgi:hypothetical protein
MIRILALSIALLAAPAWAAWDLDQLMKSLGANKASRATFVEKKYLAMLDAPVTPRANCCSRRPTGWSAAPSSPGLNRWCSKPG